MIQIEIGAIASFAIVSLAYVLRALTPSGAFAAFAIGTVVFAIGGWPAAAVLLAFFVTASLLSRVGARRKRHLADFGKQGPRDAWQVFANGGIAAACIAVSRTTDAPLTLAFAGALAAATADTWSTEIGTLARRGVRSILTFRPVQSGLSGGVSLPGTIAQFAGAAFIALVAYDVHLAPFWPVAIGGAVGGLFDSILGASAQALRWCPMCARPCEANPHSCGTPTTMFRGLAWIDNDVVNLLATLCGAGVAVLVASHWPRLW
ncbi:MAG TPA: DUF92 domain-containing protein [Candidatus Tyrphobacter sp.]